MGSRDEARYVPVETVGVWAWQVAMGDLQELADCMSMLCDYGYRLTAATVRMSGMLAVVDENGQSQCVGDLDWIVFENGEVKTVSKEAFAKHYRKFTNTTK